MTVKNEFPFKDLSDRLMKALHLERRPVGVLWTTQKPEGIQRTPKVMKVCQFLDVARLEDKVFYTDIENNADCKNGCHYLGLHPSLSDRDRVSVLVGTSQTKAAPSFARLWLSVARSNITASCRLGRSNTWCSDRLTSFRSTIAPAAVSSICSVRPRLACSWPGPPYTRAAA